MNNKPATITESQAASLTGRTRPSIEGILRAAGLAPISETEKKTGTHRLWPRVEALKILRNCDAAATTRYRDQAAHAQAEIIALQEALRNGTRIPIEQWFAWLDRYALTTITALTRIIPGKAREVAEINAMGLPEGERRAKLHELFSPILDYIIEAKRTPTEWNV